MERRAHARLAGALLLALALGGCHEPLAPTADQQLGRLSARPRSPTGSLFGPGRRVLDLGLDRDPVLYVPAVYDPAAPAPLIVLFHGAGGNAGSWVSPYEHADRLGIVLLIMQSRESTWDLSYGGWGPDVAAVDRALEIVFDRCAIDPGAVAFGGFSDGASYALSLGLRNNDLASRLIAFSPGYWLYGPERDPQPRIFVSHGYADQILSVQNTRAMVGTLTDDGYDVTYLEFQGGHEVPAAISRAAFDWLVPAPAPVP